MAFLPSAAAGVLHDVAGAVPELAPELSELEELFSRKLWHQLTLIVDKIVAAPAVRKTKLGRRLYELFIKSVEKHLKPLKLAEYGCRLASGFDSADELIEFHDDFVAKLQSDKEACAVARLSVAEARVMKGELREADTIIDECENDIRDVGAVEPFVQGRLHVVKAVLAKARGEADEFYRHALQSFAFIPLESFYDSPEQVKLGEDICIAAIIGESTQGFGELIGHPVFEVARQSVNRWLAELVECMNTGDVEGFERVLDAHKERIAREPSLAGKEDKLREKVRLLAAMNLAFSKPPHERVLSFEEISAATGTPVDRVEILLIRAFATKVLKGLIDEPNQNVHITWIKPRVLTVDQVAGLRDRLDAWTGEVDKTVSLLKDQAPEFFQ
uniref:PCI domain-containing protein n=1 Tax=Palpitomonas bilix TaxID=652834 RepID=A0A7S3DIZ3_9EUKA|mmetsp:Transcript_39175/g.100370  ORF Transcript_39175/g.100370 Transcript_39175/m.100370 type:complete len:387 (+) Transcript_39175:166-1326(+)